MTKQTAVEWLVQEINKINVSNEARIFINKLEKQAKEMEKEQKIKFANDYGFHICGYDYENAEEYYNQTSKQQTP